MTPCWTWPLVLDRDGYAKVRRSGRDKRMHRLVLELLLGRSLDGLLVLHKCDNRACVNPEHLYAGTSADNTRDMVQRGRQARGLRVGTARLAPENVRWLRWARAYSGATYKVLGRAFGIGQTQAYNVCSGKSPKENAL